MNTNPRKERINHKQYNCYIFWSNYFTMQYAPFYFQNSRLHFKTKKSKFEIFEIFAFHLKDKQKLPTFNNFFTKYLFLNCSCRKKKFWITNLRKDAGNFFITTNFRRRNLIECHWEPLTILEFSSILLIHKERSYASIGKRLT